jgi:drug/metabolite transporter (DMT)-like permease
MTLASRAAALGPNQRGSLYMVLGMGGFAAEDAFIKLAAAHLPAGQIMLVLGLLGGPLFAAAARARGHRPWSREALHWAVVGRNLSEMGGSLCFVAALALAPLVMTTAIFQAMPLAVTMGAALFLDEKVGWRRWTAIVVGFGGVLVIVRPGAADFEPGALLAVGAVLGLGARDLFTRRIPGRIDTMLLTSWGFLSVALVGGLQLLVAGGAVAPTGPDAGLLLGALAFGAGGYWLLTESTRVGELWAIMPFRYSRLLFGLMLGVLLFGERPDAWTLVGAALIVASGIYAFTRERARARAAALSTTAAPR